MVDNGIHQPFEFFLLDQLKIRWLWSSGLIDKGIRLDNIFSFFGAHGRRVLIQMIFDVDGKISLLYLHWQVAYQLSRHAVSK
mmetsp:Transcript_12887/g.24202  ORF Transcript_12887/g.24202 Transcript_12887/m.24202 type:complete len:82 (-) Transcript_12887:216-461(-)